MTGIGIGLGVAVAPLRLGAANSEWSPTALPGIAAWYKASAGLLMDGFGVYEWQDESGNGRHLVQATDAAKPGAGTLNGLAALDFDGVDDWLGTGDAVPKIGAGDFYSASVVSIGSGWSGQDTIYNWWGAGGLQLRTEYLYWQLLHAGTALIRQDIDDLLFDTPFIIQVQKSGTSFDVWVNAAASEGPWTYAPDIGAAEGGTHLLRLGVDYAETQWAIGQQGEQCLVDLLTTGGQ